MLSFTALFTLFALLMLVVIFGLTYKFKGLKVALVSTAAALVVTAILFVAVIYAIVSAMPN